MKYICNHLYFIHSVMLPIHYWHNECPHYMLLFREILIFVEFAYKSYIDIWTKIELPKTPTYKQVYMVPKMDYTCMHNHLFLMFNTYKQ